MATREEWSCPRCGLEGDHLKTPDPARCVQCLWTDAAPLLYRALKAVSKLPGFEAGEPYGRMVLEALSVAETGRDLDGDWR